jgi:hypothetical protein
MEQHLAQQQTLPLSTAYVVQIVPPSEIEREALAMENLLQAFSLEEPFSLEICGEKRRQRFLLRAESQSTLETLCYQLLAQYPQAQIRRLSPIADPLAMKLGEHAIIGDFSLRAPTWMPIKTFWDEEMTQEGTDPVVGLLSAMEPVKSGERIICQISLVSAPDTWIGRYKRKAVEHPLDKERQEMRQPQSSTTDDELWREGRVLLLLLLGTVLGFQGYTWYRNQAWLPLTLLITVIICGIIGFTWWWLNRDNTMYDMDLVSKKLMRVGFYTQVRVIIIGDVTSTEERLRSHIKRLEVAYRQYNLANSNGFLMKKIRHIHAEAAEAQQLYRPTYSFPYQNVLSRLMHHGRSDVVLNAREVSGMWHLLQTEAEAPLIERLTTRRILAHPELFKQIQQKSADFRPVLIGQSHHRGYSVPIYLPEETLFSHKFVVAKSGYGKSTLMQLLLRGAMVPVPRGSKRLQPGVVAIDPHGDLISDLLRQIPGDRNHDVILIDLADEDHPVGINLLDATMGFTSDQAIANMMASFARIWGESWGPRLAYVVKHVLKTLYIVNEVLVAQDKADEQYTLLDVNPLLQQTKYARKVLGILDKNNLQHQKELSWWNDYYFKLPPAFQQEVISPVSNKIGIFADNHTLERIVGQPKTTIDVASSITDGKIILVNLASGRLEFDAAAIIGATILNLVHRMLQLQAHIPFPERRQVFIAVDEFQNIPGADYEALLSEDRKYGGSLMLATQSLVRLEQMKEGLEAITFSNCAQLFVFATSAEDGEKLEKELHEQVTVAHILNQPRLNCFAKLALPDQPLQIFSMQLARPEGWKRSPEHEARAETIRVWNQERHLSRAEVDALLEAHTKRYLNVGGEANKPGAKKAPTPANPSKQAGQGHSSLLALQATGSQAVTSKRNSDPPPPRPGENELAGEQDEDVATDDVEEEEEMPGLANTPGQGEQPRKKRKKRKKRKQVPAQAGSQPAEPPVLQGSAV